MFSITVSFGNSGCQLLFKTEAKAQNALTFFAAESDEAHPKVTVLLADDFGRVLQVKLENVIGIVFENLELSKEGQIEMSLHQARLQINGQKRGMADPVIAAAQRMQSGPSIVSSMPGNGRGF